MASRQYEIPLREAISLFRSSKLHEFEVRVNLPLPFYEPQTAVRPVAGQYVNQGVVAVLEEPYATLWIADVIVHGTPTIDLRQKVLKDDSRAFMAFDFKARILP